ncbi:MAG: helicase C-terminal domain-containing protein [Longimicrobiales bacterium]
MSHPPDIPPGFPIDTSRAVLVGLDGLEPDDDAPAPEKRRAPARPLRLSDAARRKVRDEIARAGGREVCFLADVDEGRVVRDPRAVARGNFAAVLAASRDAPEGGVMLHNHPSGVLEPSEADMRVAAQLYEQGIGTAITDNEGAGLYVVVEPPRPRVRVPLDPDELEAVVAPGGALADRHDGYEDRPGQRAMLREVVRVFNDHGVSVIEAGTGTGKSLAYLLPAARWAQENGERTVVSTNTINLQEQLAGKDLPLVQELLGEEVPWALVKGRGNYISIRRAFLAAEQQGSLFDDDRSSEMESLLEWMRSTDDGSLSDLSFSPEPDTWEEVRSDPDICLRAKCPHFQQCFYQKSRRRAAAATLLVVNHHLLFTDIAVRRATRNWTQAAVLPAYKRVVLDEAHNVEDAATQHLGVEVTRRGLYRVLSRLDRRGRGILTAVHDGLAGNDEGANLRVRIENRVRPALSRARAQMDGFIESLETCVDRGATARLGPGGIGEPIDHDDIRERMEALTSTLGTLERELAELRARIELDEELAQSLEGRLLDLRSVERRIAAHIGGIRLVLAPGDDADAWVRWLEVRGSPRRANLAMAAAPIALGPVLRESLFTKMEASVLTSATLATRKSFAFLRGRLGLEPEAMADEDPPVAVSEQVVASPFDYPSQTLLAVPTDLPAADGGGTPAFQEATARVVADLAGLSDGGLFVLFTSHGALRTVAALLRDAGVDGRWPLFVHGEEDRHRLLGRFVDARRGILLGTASFWEGVDVPGDPLRGLVIQKLPFRVPTEPITAARMERIEEEGGSAFHDFMLPHAALRLKQGFGRLIRARTDRGAVVLLDDRIVSRRYGRYLRDSLPDAPLARGPWDDVRRRLKAFYQDDPSALGVRRPAP